MIATSWHTSSTRSSWWLENTTATPVAAVCTSNSASDSTPSGSRPLNGSSSTASTGSWTSAAASCTRCWLPWESSSSRASARPPSPRRVSHRRRGLLGSGAGQPGELGEIDELLAHPHPRVQPTLFRHVPETVALRGSDGRAIPSDLAPIRAHQPEDRPHRGGLARAVRSEEPHDPSRRHGEGRSVEGEHVGVALRQIVDLKHEQSRTPPGNHPFLKPSRPIESHVQ